VISSLTVISGDVEAVFAFHLVVEASCVGKNDLCVPGPAVEQNDLERQLRPPLVHGVPAYVVYAANKFPSM